MENSLLAIFDEIWPKTLYYNSTVILAKFYHKWLGEISPFLYFSDT